MENLNLEQLCQSCALCCNGVIFADVRLRRGDDAARLKALGLPLARRGQTLRFNQPCAALDCTRCRVYADRPSYCHQFECALYKACAAGRIALPAALRLVQEAHRRVDWVRSLLRALGETTESMALSLRFKQVQKRMESGPFSETDADLYGELTLAVHNLNVLLSEKFCPGSE